MNHGLPRLISSSGLQTGTLVDAGHKDPEEKPWRLDFESAFPRTLYQQRPPGMWRYEEALPVDVSRRVSLGEGLTPLVNLEDDGRNLLLKCEHHLPSGSYKDRGAALLVSALHQAGVVQIKEDSSGNAGAALAAYAARAGLQATIYVPAHASGGKLAQIRNCGVDLKRIDGPRQAATDAVLAEQSDVYYASHIWNPFFEHGVKTMAFEIAEQLGWQAPPALILPVGHGGLLLALHRGFSELHQAGILKHRPQLFAVQAENCAPLAGEWHGQKPAETSRTRAEGIAISQPSRGAEVLKAVAESDGDFLTVSESEISDAQHYLQINGFCVEPTSAVPLAAWLKTTTLPSSAVIPLTGHGLKAV